MEKKRHALRKLLEAVEKELLKKPNRKTLDRLSLLAGFQDWESFKETVQGDLGGETIYGGHREMKDEKLKMKGDRIEVSVTVKNTGNVAGKEVAQLYVTAPKGKLEKPAQELKSFAKTRELQPGESQTLTMTLLKRDLASFDEAGSQWVTEAGQYLFKVGNSSRDIKLTASLKLTEYTEATHNAMAPKQPLNLLKQK